MNLFGGTSLIPEDNTLLVWGAVVAFVGFAVWAEKRWKWAKAMSAVCICLVGGFILSNIGILPHACASYNAMSNILLPVSIPMFLFKADIKTIVKDSGKLFGLFHIAAVGTMLGVLICFLVLGRVENAKYILGLIGAGSVGGTVNVVAMADMFYTPPGVMEAYLVVGNFCFLFLYMIANWGKNNKFVQKMLPGTLEYENKIHGGDANGTGDAQTASDFWGGKEISLLDIAKAFGSSLLIVGVSSLIASWVQSLGLPMFLEQMFGSIYMIMTLISVFCATVFRKFFSNIRGSMEFGTICMFIWQFTVGASGDLSTIITTGLLAAALFLGVAIVNMIVTFFGAKLMKMSWQETIGANFATVGGPPTAAAVAISNGWSSLIIPGLLVGIWGYIIGNYCGIVVCNLMGLEYIL